MAKAPGAYHRRPLPTLRQNQRASEQTAEVLSRTSASAYASRPYSLGTPKASWYSPADSTRRASSAHSQL